MPLRHTVARFEGSVPVRRQNRHGQGSYEREVSMSPFRFPHVAILLGMILVGVAAAQDAPDLQVAESAQWGPHLVDAAGMSLYVYLNDEPGVSTCVDACTNNWPPLTIDGDPELGGAVDASLVGTYERPDGSTQVTYGQMPLYRYARDGDPGDTRGQGLGGAFFLLSPAAEVIREEVAQERVELPEELFASLMEAGQSAYATNCAVCHGAEGAGQIGPGLADNDILERTDFVITRILNGFPEHGMPPFRTQLDDFEIAAIATFIRNSWDNDFGGVTQEEVMGLR